MLRKKDRTFADNRLKRLKDSLDSLYTYVYVMISLFFSLKMMHNYRYHMVCVITPDVSIQTPGFSRVLNHGSVIKRRSCNQTAEKVVINPGDKNSNVLKIRTSIRTFEFLDFIATKKTKTKK